MGVLSKGRNMAPQRLLYRLVVLDGTPLPVLDSPYDSDEDMTQMKQLLPLQRIGVMDRGLTAQSVKGLLVLKWWRVEGLAELWAIPEIEADPLCKLDTRVAKYTVRALAMMYKHTFK